jgi:hypothetical protein
MKKNIFVGLITLCAVILVGCTETEFIYNGPMPDGGKPDDKPVVIDYWELDATTANNLTVVEEKGEYSFVTTGGDPFISSIPLISPNNADSVVLSFDYIASSGIDDFEIFFSPVAAGRSESFGELKPTDQWTNVSINLKDYIAKYQWGNAGDFLRFDFGKTSDVSFKVRKIYLRSMTDEESSATERVELLAETLDEYLNTNYSAKVENISLNTSSNMLVISGNTPSDGKYMICEIAPYHDVTIDYQTVSAYDINNGNFAIEVPRNVRVGNIIYDKILSKWAIVKVEDDVRTLVSHARYIDELTPSVVSQITELTTKKGLAGVGPAEISMFSSDLDELGIGSTTYNIDVKTVITSKAGADTEPYNYGGKIYYINKLVVNQITDAIRQLNERNLSVAAIILVSPGGDPTINELLNHPRYTQGYYTMPNMTTLESVNCYAAVLDYLARTFSSKEAKARIDHWIMHNEVDQGHIWTNMGDKGSTPANYYFDTYVKSVRMAYNIIRQYNDKSEIFTSFTHFWSQDENGNREYAAKPMLERMVKYSALEGDCKWALAYHSYPQDLTNPEVWNDPDAVNDMNTKYVSFKNLEILGKWITEKDHLYKGSVKRSLWLSENGINTHSYSDEDLDIQAAGCAYALKKVMGVNGIDAIQWHRWIDHPDEGGLRLGLRKFTDTENGGMKKNSYEVFKAIGNSDEDEVTEKYKSIIGINDWSEIFY